MGVNEAISCITSVATVDGITASDHGCDDDLFFCNGLNNECVDKSFAGVSYQICCCNGNLCNSPDSVQTTTTTTATSEPSSSGSFLHSSVLVFLSSLMAKLL